MSADASTKRIPGNTKLDTTRYTIVQHSGYVGGGNGQFRQGLESAGISTYAQLRAVEEANGQIFDSYTLAENYAEAEMYTGVSGLIPKAPGTFHASAKVNGLPLYLPVATRYRLSVTTLDGEVIDLLEVAAQPGTTASATVKAVIEAAAAQVSA